MGTDCKQGIKVQDLLKLIPDDLLADLSSETNVDYQVKKLYGRNVFSLLLFGLIESDRLGLRSLEDFYNSTHYKVLFNIPNKNTTKYNSLSARLATMNVDFFRKAYEAIYEQCSQLYDENDLALNYKLSRVDSTMVCQTAAKLENGIHVGCKKDGKKQIKYTVCLTDMFPSSVEVFNQQCHISENLTIPKAIFRVIDKNKDNVFVFDRGVSDRQTFCKLDQEEYTFVTRLKSDARFIALEDFEISQDQKVRNLTILKDQRVYLYKSGTSVVEHSFRLVQAINDKGYPYFFLTNMFSIPAKDIITIYKSRWDIEVFFRFIKQELNFSHFISVNENGIKILLYMTLILSMLILIYKKINGLGYKTAKRRFMIEMWDIIAIIMIKHSGGDPSLVFR
ncbi:protein containing transposase DDE domain [Lentimicrobium saccharophilum]|uniref:Protein containing transposase DDE domain n=1 Tax=Lentimicrobium saccharophilum TaxID=1678841 RepID=A0A0S7C066_9BACT|nr:IS4 family transposase [Lentimicrobium saccharophilum]GAP41979.1 protein containing transposase DDE domain [Lentimicrobium saccharophilum]GAP42119.1 protein containing transposase DDE domain [Lentimicrobium saccharophilum]GAP43728.1 protein containing transposase DDE domain [Lentimicrobium saccharophilum]GAP43736.1 protein containing transposase DDE domain [Lentimicrobium saccharophilum]GAP44267.1 protein containing transposase DDE domain [Lentimicrobium saccharophilum]